MKISIGIIAAVLVVAAASLASSVFAPLALALFIIALVWPVQSWLQARISKLPALAVTIVMTLAVGLALASWKSLRARAPGEVRSGRLAAH